MKELKSQLAGALLVIVTAALVIAAFINFQQLRRFRLPDDGVTWVERTINGQEHVEALRVESGGPAAKAGLRDGDLLVSIKGVAIEKATDVPQVLFSAGVWRKAEYKFSRDGVEAQASVLVREADPSSPMFYQYVVGGAYLIIGLFVYFRRGNAHKSIHFYLICLASFVMSALHATGKLNLFDQAIYLANYTASLLVPALFLHFCLTFPETPRGLRGARAALLYVPSALLLLLFWGVSMGFLVIPTVSLIEQRWLIDRGSLLYLAAMYLGGAVVLNRNYQRMEDTMVRQQLKWLRNGALLGAVPFVAGYVIPYALGVIPNRFMDVTTLTLALIPLTWSYAIFRYRLMDVDVIFQQGYVHTLATLSVLGIVYGLILTLGKFEELSPTAFVFLILMATFIFQPIRNWIQEVLDRNYFYKDKYDYRMTLIEFARELSSETDLYHMLESVAERLTGTLSIQHMSFFLFNEDRGEFELEMQAGRKTAAVRYDLDLSFLKDEAPERPYLFFERTRQTLDVVTQEMPASVRHTIAELDLTYYIPCRHRGRNIAYLGVSRTTKGDFLSSDDVELLQTLSGYVGIAIENSRLYRSLEHKVVEYERLKEFSENIVESINVGILAADLDDRVESWNNQIEKLTGISREMAVGQRLSDLFPETLCNQFDAVSGRTGIHHIYKFVLRARDLPVRAVSMAANGHSNGYSNGNGHATMVAVAPAPRESTLNVAIAPLISKDQEQIGRLVIFDDVTDRAELERRLVQADKLSSIGLLAAGVAHEVNTPLAVISTYAQMLAKQVSGDETKSKMLEKIAKQTFRASEIVNGLLNFSRTSSTEYEEIELNRVLRETVGLIEHQLQKASVEVRLDLDAALPAIKGNAGKMQQVFLNLALNARDAMEGGGTLTVRSWSEEGSVHVEVADTGSGITPEHVSRIYDPFFTTKGAKKGTGLGLAVTYGIVREHGGTIEVKSQPGLGTRFLLEFPLVRKPVNA
ncbi:MAG: ATP-binding protein [Bryobacteraceae bacterium]